MNGIAEIAVCACGCGKSTAVIPVRGNRRALAGQRRQFVHGHNMRGRARPDKSPPIETRFWAKVDRSAGEHGCWPWIGQRTMAGYGQIKDHGRPVYAHRVALALALGRPLEVDEQALHHCDNPPCVKTEPDAKYPDGHLYAGTRSDNMRDCWSRSRRRSAA